MLLAISASESKGIDCPRMGPWGRTAGMLWGAFMTRIIVFRGGPDFAQALVGVLEANQLVRGEPRDFNSSPVTSTDREVMMNIAQSHNAEYNE